MKTKNVIFFALLFLTQVFFAQNNQFVVGYMPTYSNFPNAINSADLNILTHIDIAFVNPDANANIYMPNGTATVVNAAHAKNVKVLASICGGGGNGNIYQTILSNNNLTNTFVANLVQMTINNNLDGIDVDIEGDVLNGTYVNAAQYESFILKLRDALHAQNKLITSALAGWFIQHITNTAAQAFDLIGLMSYDAYGGWTGPGQHSPYSMAVNDFNTFRNKGVDANKLLIGLPFYGYGWGNNQRAWTFNEITNTFPGSENNDQVGSGANVIYYNGIPTIKQKCTFAQQNAGGVMIWELTQDASGNKSLLQAIGEVMGSNNANLVPDNLAKNKTVSVSSTDVSAAASTTITDGFYNTRWSSNYNDNEFFTVDLGDEYNINQVKITWEAASAKNYEVQFSSDGTNFSTGKTISNNSALVNDQTALTGKARYVRIACSARNTVYGYSVYELEVYGTAIAKPYWGTAISLPGKVEAEHYDLGGEGVAYHELSAGNQYAQFRSDNVDLETCTDAGGGYNIGSAQAGEWLAYSVDVSQTNLYDVEVRVATNQNGRTFHLEMNGQNITGSIQVPNTGGWQTYASIVIPNVQLQAGLQQLQVKYDSEYLNLNYMNFALALSTSMQENEILEMNLFPNPAFDILKYSISAIDDKGGFLNIYNSLGELVKSENINSSSGQISIENLASGIYFAQFVNKHSNVIKEVVVR
jgi:chitinase